MTPAKPTPPYKHRLLEDFGPRQREFLLRATTQGVELDHPLATSHRVACLQGAGLIHKRVSKKGRTSWRTTDLGRAITAGHVPRLLAAKSQYGYVHEPRKAMWQEPEAA